MSCFLKVWIMYALSSTINYESDTDQVPETEDLQWAGGLIFSLIFINMLQSNVQLVCFQVLIMCMHHN